MSCLQLESSSSSSYYLTPHFPCFAEVGDSSNPQVWRKAPNLQTLTMNYVNLSWKSPPCSTETSRKKDVRNISSSYVILYTFSLLNFKKLQTTHMFFMVLGLHISILSNADLWRESFHLGHKITPIDKAVNKPGCTETLSFEVQNSKLPSKLPRWSGMTWMEWPNQGFTKQEVPAVKTGWHFKKSPRQLEKDVIYEIVSMVR